MHEKYLLMALMPQLAFWMLITGLAIVENRALKRRIRDLEAELGRRKG